MTQFIFIGKVLRNHYKIINQLGSGAFGDTYLATDIDLPDSPYRVVKHLCPKYLDQSGMAIAKQLFDREAKVLYSLGQQHNQIPQLYAHFEEQGQFYLVQEYIAGHDLSEELLPGQQRSEVQTLTLMREICSVLSFVHQNNVVHRDLKPQNIRRRDNDGKLVLIDFGAVKEIQVLQRDAQGQTQVTVAIGTSGYMPSEQANGRPKLSSDVYAVGIIALQALTGIHPQQLPQDPSTGKVLWRNSAPQVSDAMAEVLDRMVQDHFSQRFHSATEVLTALMDIEIAPQSSASEPHYRLQSESQTTKLQSDLSQTDVTVRISADSIPRTTLVPAQQRRSLGWFSVRWGIGYVITMLLSGYFSGLPFVSNILLIGLVRGLGQMLALGGKARWWLPGALGGVIGFCFYNAFVQLGSLVLANFCFGAVLGLSQYFFLRTQSNRAIVWPVAYSIGYTSYYLVANVFGKLLIPGDHMLGLTLRIGIIHGGYAVLSGLLLIWMVRTSQNKQKK
ncbi:MAG: serine/threonine protein kinase [Leptolyngbya sp. SIO3F4]|nr:serine/threonine protein kinase [Leptolyngbya sp. SIO3F4]